MRIENVETWRNHSNPLKPNWGQVAVYVGVTLAVTYLLDLVLYLTVGYGSHPATVMLLQLQMLLPAAVAIVLQFDARDSAPPGFEEIVRAGAVVPSSPLHHVLEDLRSDQAFAVASGAGVEPSTATGLPPSGAMRM